MELPSEKLNVDTFIKINDLSLGGYIAQLRKDLVPEIRKLEKSNDINWYCVLIHDQGHLGGRVPQNDQNLYIHIRLGLPEGSNIDEFMKNLPPIFQQPIQNPIGPMGSFNASMFKDQDWRYAWKLLGEASEWVLDVVESYEGVIPVDQIIQLLHYITNPLLLGNKSLFIPSGFMTF